MNFNHLTFLGIICSVTISCDPKESTEAFKDGFIQSSDKTELYYQVRGSADDSVVVIHGGPGAGINSFLPSVHPLVKDYTLILYDQRGGGKSTLPEDTNKLHPQYFVEDLEAIRRHFKLSSMNVLTHSFGSIVLAEYATIYPDRLKRVIFHGSTGPIRADMGAYYQAKSRQAAPIADTSLINRASELLANLLEGKAEDPISACREYEQISKKIAVMRGELVSHKGSTCDAPPEAVKYYYQYTAQLGPALFGNWDYTGKLDNFTSPVLIMYGILDSLAIPSQKSWTEIIPNSRLLLVPKADKGSLSDNPEFALHAIKRFLDGNDLDSLLYK